MGKLRTDGSGETGNELMQVFTPKRIESVAAEALAWTPDDSDRAFLATADCNMSINGGTEFPLQAYSPLGIVPGFIYTFGAPVLLLVM